MTSDPSAQLLIRAPQGECADDDVDVQPFADVLSNRGSRSCNGERDAEVQLGVWGNFLLTEDGMLKECVCVSTIS